MRKAAPLMNTLAHSVAVSAMASIDQRRSVLIDSTDTPPIVACRLTMLNCRFHILRSIGAGAWLRAAASRGH